MRIKVNCSDTKKIIPWGGCGKFMFEVVGAWLKIRASWAVPSHLANTKVKHMFQSHATVIFCVGIPFVPINLACSLGVTTHGTWVPSIVPMTLLKSGQYRVSFSMLAWLSWNKGSSGLIYSIDNLRREINTLWRCLLTVSSECWNLS